MTSEDRPTFEHAFNRIAKTFRLKLSDERRAELCRSYFELFSGAKLDDVVTAGETCLRRCKTFPKPVEWFAALPATVKDTTPELRRMTVTEAQEWTRAERNRWNGDPCTCFLCQDAGVTERLLRFVPEFTDDDREIRVFHPILNRAVVQGHWAHGDELRRWYVAKDAFFSSAPAFIGKLVPLSGVVPIAREPGEEG